MIPIATTSQIYQKSHLSFQLNEAELLDSCPAWLLLEIDHQALMLGYPR